MRRAKHLVRQALLAAFILFPMSALAEVSSRFDHVSGNVALRGLDPDQRAEILADPAKMRLQVSGLETQRGMLATVKSDGADLVITPRFALRPGTDYVVHLTVEGTTGASQFTVPAADAVMPALTGFAPSQSVIPANTLRMYVQFSEPMARGQFREAITLWRSEGVQVESPFLTLGPELWDPTQTRLTLLLDPGRVKQGVGPNAVGGAPLVSGEAYQLVVSGEMKSAVGVPLGQDATISIRAGDAERRAITPGNWRVLRPQAGSQMPLTVTFARIMDSGAVVRLLTLENDQGRRVRGQVNTDGGGWSLVPDHPWQAGTYQLIVAPELEDVSGNSIGVPFDAATGTIGQIEEAVILNIDITD
ncbi:MAG: hypothetical protein HKN27_16220 [Silicimonas sp.]|nr:hypothetical protein [Silicimonas sp.]